MPVTIYHNPRCSKSRQTLALLEEKGVDLDTILYLQDPPDAATIADLVAKLDLASARDLMRKGEAVYKDLGLKDVTDEAALIQTMADNPILIERPIVLNGGKARIGRPPEGVLEIV
jgi:arsenate reductase